MRFLAISVKMVRLKRPDGRLSGHLNRKKRVHLVSDRPPAQRYFYRLLAIKSLLFVPLRLLVSRSHRSRPSKFIGYQTAVMHKEILGKLQVITAISNIFSRCFEVLSEEEIPI